MTFWNLAPSAESADELDLTVYGYIAESAVWDDEVGAREFRQALDEHKTIRRINVRINSGGGDAFAGIAIHSMLQAHPAEILVTVEGLAGSAASLIAMAGHVTMARGAMMMVHNPSAIVLGGAEDMRHTADVLDGLRDSLVAIYQAKTGKTAEELQELLDAETWLTAQQAVDQGFADVVVGEVVPEARGEAVYFNSIRYPRGRVPQAALPPEPTPEPAAHQEDPMPVTREQLAADAPELLASILDEGHAAGCAAERARLKAIDEVALPGHDALVQRARYEEPITAEALAMQILRAERAHRAEHLANAAADAAEAEVPAAPQALPVAPSEADEVQAKGKAIAAGSGRR